MSKKSNTIDTPKMTFQDFIDKYHLAIADAVMRDNDPIYNAAARTANTLDLSLLKRSPLLAQADAIKATVMSVESGEILTTICGEMGVGKSFVAAAVAYFLWKRRVLPKAKIILCPPHLVRKWRDELYAAVPNVRVVIVSSLETLRNLPDPRTLDGPLFVVLNREKAKMSYEWRPVTVKRWWRDPESGTILRDEETGLRMQVHCCVACYAPILTDEGLPVRPSKFQNKRMKCDKCGGALWTAQANPVGVSPFGGAPQGKGMRRQALADYIYENMSGFFDLLIVDECHEFKAKDSAQGFAAGTLAAACGRILALTGTLLGGYSSTLFYLLYRFNPKVRAEFGWKDSTRWIKRYGFLERVTKTKARDEDDTYASGRQSKRQMTRVTEHERPGVTPHILYQLLGNTVFIRLAHVSKNLPKYTEIIKPIDMQGAELLHSSDEYKASQAGCYEALQSSLLAAVKEALTKGSKRLLGAYLQALLAWPDACFREERVIDRWKGEQIGYAPALPADVLYPKEKALVDLILAEKAEGRKSCVYITHTGERDLASRLEPILRAKGLKVAVLKTSSPKAEARMDWINKQVAEGADVLLTNPKLVQTGLDLLDFPTIIWAEVDYSTYVLRQASRRSWRIGQKREVRLFFMVYTGTLQAAALALVAAKLRASLMVEGEVAQEGLAAHNVQDGDMMVMLARKMAEGGRVDPRGLEALFAANREAEVKDESFLVADAWHSAVADTVPICVAGQKFAPLHDGPLDPSLLDLPLFASYGDGDVTGAVALLPGRPKVKRAARVVLPDRLIAQLGLWS